MELPLQATKIFKVKSLSIFIRCICLLLNSGFESQTSFSLLHQVQQIKS